MNRYQEIYLKTSITIKLSDWSLECSSIILACQYEPLSGGWIMTLDMNQNKIQKGPEGKCTNLQLWIQQNFVGQNRLHGSLTKWYLVDLPWIWDGGLTSCLLYLLVSHKNLQSSVEMEYYSNRKLNILTRNCLGSLHSSNLCKWYHADWWIDNPQQHCLLMAH